MRFIPKTVYLKLGRAASIESLPENILNFLSSGWRLKALVSSKERRDFYDTFEWQAFEKGIIIVKKKRTLFLADLDTGMETTSLPFPGNPSFFFSDTLNPCKLKEKLCSCSTIRAFMKLCSVDALMRSYRILDENKKTIAILTSESLRIVDNHVREPFIHLFALSPCRGYEDEIADVEKALMNNNDIDSTLEFRELFKVMMEAAGHTVQNYSSKISLTLDPHAPIHESARHLLQFTFSVMRLNEVGIKKNIDSEFLHDYRVAIRRTRSILKQLNGVFDAGETAYYLTLFRNLGKRTNELRDRDVYLLQRATYFHYLPPTLQPSLKIFFDSIAASRKMLHRQFSRYLSSVSYKSFLVQWGAYLDRPPHRETEQIPKAFLSTRSVAVKSIKKAWQKVIRHGRLVSRETTDAELHGLRIDCKKLRYLLEFFASIFPHNTIHTVIRQLKELQENLGDFVDFTVQLRFLHDQLEMMPADKLLAASTGGLMAILFQKQEEARLKFHNTFRSFDREQTSQLFQDLLTSTVP
ncbi:MAG: CHAD domain-containing protein [Chlorobiaceae bacterium]